MLRSEVCREFRNASVRPVSYTHLSIGVVLAKVLGYQFIDSDLLIQKEEKRTLSEIIEQDGIDGFKAVENRVNASIQVENTVIATGGSVVYCDEAMQLSLIHI